MEATPTSAAVQPVASWNFEDAAGDQLTDNSGNGNHGTIHGATWVEIDGGHALRFDGVDDYVDCGNGEGLDLQVPLSLEVWANPATVSADEPGIAGKFFESYLITVYRGAAHFYISSGGNGVRGGIKTNAWSHIVGVFDGTKLRIYVNGELINEQTTKYPEARPGKNFTIGAVFGDPDNPDKFLRPSRFFPGMIDNVRLYDQALSAENVIRAFNEGAAIKGREPFDTSRFDKLGLNAFAYARQQEIQVTFDYRWIQPLPEGTRVEVRIIEPSSATALKSASAEANSPDYQGKLIIDAADLAPGLYVVHTRAGDVEAETSIQWPPARSEPAAPDVFVAAPLPAAIVPPAYELDVAATGGMTVTIGDESFRIASAFSYPDGGHNTLAAEKGDQAEPDWKSTVRATGDDTFELLAGGAFYSLRRQLRKTPTRIEVEDTFTNASDDVIGIMLSNYIDVYATDAWPILHSNPTVFAARSGIGVGIVALDDIYFLHSRNRFYKNRVELMDDHFGLAADASYTVRWAIYPTATENYFDFINQVRHDEKINGHCEGGLTLSTGWITLSEEEVRIKNLTYLSQCYLTRVTADPVVSIEGWEFREYPVVCERIKQTITATREKYPQMQAGFHVAHSLFTTNNPERFADSKAIDVNGNQIMYGPNNMDYYGKYFSKELVEDNWRWWIFYPSATNSFGKYMLDAADYMINEMNANFIWADGYISGYVREGFVYDHFDGHSVTIDPGSKRVTRQKAQITWTALPILKAVAQKFADAGGTLVSNGRPGPPSYWPYKVVTSCETSGGDAQPISELHLAPTVTPLGNPVVLRKSDDIYGDVLTKLELGALYFWYGETDHRPGGINLLFEEMLVTYMYPITFDNIQPGTVRGLERIVTMNPGVYGWANDDSLHMVYYSDSRGRIVPNRFTTTVDAESVRTALDLQHRESAVVAKIPLTATTSAPVNLTVRRYDAGGIEILANGNGAVTLTVSDGDFVIAPARRYIVAVNGQSNTVDAADNLISTVDLNGLTSITITP